MQDFTLQAQDGVQCLVVAVLLLHGFVLRFRRSSLAGLSSNARTSMIGAKSRIRRKSRAQMEEVNVILKFSNVSKGSLRVELARKDDLSRSKPIVFLCACLLVVLCILGPSTTFAIAFICLSTVYSRQVSEEGLVAIANVGVQIWKKNRIGFQSNQFIPISEIEDIVINEAFTMHRCIFYLVILTANRRGPLVPLFLASSPSLDVLRKIRRRVRLVLLGNDDTSTHVYEKKTKK